MQKVKVAHMGEGSTDVFSGNGQTLVIKEAYGETAKFFAEEISHRLKPDNSYKLLDVGTSRGELLQSLLSKLPTYNFETVGVDINKDILEENKVAKQKIVASIDSLPLEDKSVDISIMRYVLQWNSLERQKTILSEIARVTKKFILIEHAGADNSNPDDWRKPYVELFNGVQIPRMKREEHCYSSRDEVERIMNNLGLKFERLQEKRIENIADIFIARYKLNDEESMQLKDILKDHNYFIQTDWVIYCDK